MSSHANAIRAGQAFVEIFADDRALVRGLKSASNRIKAWADSARDRLKALGLEMLALGKIGVGMGAGVLVPMLAASKQFAGYGDVFDKMSQRTGMSAEALSELGHAAALCGTDLDTLEKAIRKQQTLLNEAAGGSASAAKKLNALGLSFADLANKNTEEQFLTFCEQLRKIPNEGQRVAMTMQIFGVRATALIPLINAGAESINDMREEARRLGISMSGDDAAAAAEFSDALERLQKLFKGMIVQIGAALAPELTALGNWFVKTSSFVIGFIQRNREFIVTMSKVAAVVAGVGAGLAALGGIVIGIGFTISALGTIAGTIFATLAGAIGLIMSPIGLLVAAVAGLGGTFLYFSGVGSAAIQWLQDRFASLLGTASKTWQGIQDAMAAGRLDLVFKVAWAGIRVVWMQGTNFLYEKWLWIAGAIQEIWAAAVGKIAELFIGAWFSIQTLWLSFCKLVTDVWVGFCNMFMNAWSAAYTAVAKGLAWIYGKLTGMDAEAMVRIVEENAQTKKQQRQSEYDNNAKQRQNEYENAMGTASKNHGQNKASINADWAGTLNTLKEDQKRKKDARKTAYDKEIAEMEADLLKEQQKLDAAVGDAANVRASLKPDEEKEKQAKTGWAVAAQESKAMKSGGGKAGTFNAFEMGAIQGNTMEDTLKSSLRQELYQINLY